MYALLSNKTICNYSLQALVGLGLATPLKKNEETFLILSQSYNQLYLILNVSIYQLPYEMGTSLSLTQ